MLGESTKNLISFDLATQAHHAQKPRDLMRYPFDRPWGYVRLLYRELKNNVEKNNANIIGLILVVIPYAGITA